MWLPALGVSKSTSQGMARIDGRYKRANIETISKDGQPVAQRAFPLPTRFSINLNKAQIPAAYLGSEYGVWIEDMRNYMEQCIVGLRFDPAPITLDITFGFRQLDPGILAQCGPGDGTWNPLSYLGDLRLDASNAVATVRHATMVFNTDYFQVNPTTPSLINWKNIFFRTAVHECMHAVGVGAVWNGPFRIITAFPFVILLSSTFAYNVIGTGNPTNPHFTAPNALSAWRETMQGQAGATGIPIENYGMSATTIMTQAGGTALAHWRAVPGGGSLTGIRDHQGRDLAAEVMCTWSSSFAPNAWVGKFTIASLRDIGYDVSYMPLEVGLWDYQTV
ncbi:MAG: hypothetical protein C5B60_02560 [Chloroflexi bacterium]|nr:MAG: hypothetical protein C5B60_02560 [Chloroflexota bacterium]